MSPQNINQSLKLYFYTYYMSKEKLLYWYNKRFEDEKLFCFI